MTEVARRQQLIKNDMELTKENWRLSVIQGKLIDADGSLLYDWNAEFGQAQAPEVNFDLQNQNPASGVLRQQCNHRRKLFQTRPCNRGGWGMYKRLGSALRCKPEHIGSV
jgi:hypothetical protein